MTAGTSLFLPLVHEHGGNDYAAHDICTWHTSPASFRDREVEFMNDVIILSTRIEGLPPRRGKVRDIYETEDFLSIVATDWVSAFDDEAFTPDSSRFWRANAYQPGAPQEIYDKQIIRNYWLSLRWDRKPLAPYLPPAIIGPGRGPLPGNP